MMIKANNIILNTMINLRSCIKTILSFIILTLFLSSTNIFAYEDDLPITSDHRIKTYIYNPNEVYLIVVHSGFQSHIEFAKGEEINTISMGDSYAWKVTPLANRLFIKPLEKNIRTNMTILTNKRTYQFDIVARELDDEDDSDLVYVVRFYYPSKKNR